MIDEVAGKRLLLLQGPMGPFFARLAVDLRRAGASVHKVNFNAGDALFYRGPQVLEYQGDRAAFGEWIERTLEAKQIDGIVLFGDMRPLHRVAIAAAQQRGLSVWVFEEGYLRPDHTTCERDGVNGNSKMPRDPDAFRSAALKPFDDVVSVGSTFAYAAIYSTLYALAVTLAARKFPNYEHHRPINAWYHTFAWIRGALRKLWFAFAERALLPRFTNELSGRFFLVPLQVHCDAQLLHSKYDDVTDFMEEVTASFAEHADADHHLVIKHHPADRPFREYGSFVASLARRHGLQGRLHYVHDLHLPTLLRHAIGTVTINSTVGLSSVHHAAPTKVMGTAVYDLPGLTTQQSLERFWNEPGEVDLELYEHFRGWLEHHNQANGSIWKPLPGLADGAGLRWWNESPGANNY